VVWIKIEHWTQDKPEVFVMADNLGIDPDAVLGKLVRIWVWADQQTIDGNAGSVTLSLLDRVSGVTGFAKAMLKAGWLKQVDDGVQFVNFDRHNGETAKQRALTAKRVQKHRAGNASETKPKRQCNDTGVTSSLPEKRREEKNRVVIETQEPQDTAKPVREYFRRPSVQDVAEYATGICANVDPQAFCDHYQSNGWRVGKAAMRDWKAAVRNWAKRDLEAQAKGRVSGTRETPIERAIRNEQQQLDVFQQMYDAAVQQNARAAEAEQARRDAASGLLGFD